MTLEGDGKRGKRVGGLVGGWNREGDVGDRGKESKRAANDDLCD